MKETPQLTFHNERVHTPYGVLRIQLSVYLTIIYSHQISIINNNGSLRNEVIKHDSHDLNGP